MGKAKKAKMGEKGVRHAPLAEHILEDPSVRAPGRSKARNRNDEDEAVSFCLVSLIIAQQLSLSFTH